MQPPLNFSAAKPSLHKRHSMHWQRRESGTKTGGRFNSFSAASQEIAGSVLYIAPEQIMGKPRLASDQYSLGVVTYEWLSGVRPFDGTSFIEIAAQHLYTAPPPLREKVPTLSLAVEQV